MSIAKVEPLTTARALRGPFDYRLPAEMADVDVGSVLRVPFGRRRVLGVVVELAESSDLPPERLAEPIEAMETGVSAELVRLGLWVAREYCSTPSRGLRLVLPPGAGVRKRRPRKRVELPGLAGGASEPPQLLPEQERAVGEIVAALDRAAGGDRELLLHGVTGSGKTEVYLAAVEAALAQGRGAIVLVPEIGLAPQAISRFRARLGDRFAVLHSALTDGERHDEWRRLRSGEASVCVGPRSAIFAPVRELGLIVIDEEHDPSYKQAADPTYDARAVARHRAEGCGAVLVAGTATPRPESWLQLPR
ncbi:MAG: DEAD/DEAH box helicase, partial [Solirubrobacterales bacterium]